jgi:pimeloyl-ACP methyl ester carboxylesterase
MTKLPLLLLKKLFFVIAGLLAVYGAACLYLYLRQTRMIFFPSTVIETTPDELGLSYQDVWLPVASENKSDRLHGWWIPARDKSIGTLLYLHGNGVNVGANVNQANRFHQMGLSVLLIDYRGYGRSSGGFPNETTVYQDAEVAWKYLVQDRKVLPDQIFIYGHSLGGAIAIDLAVRYPEASGLIVQSSFTSIRDMVDRTRNLGLFPVNWILHQRFDSIDKVPALQMPVLFIHGTADFQVPSTMSELLYAAAPDPKRLWLVPAAGHNNVADTAGPRYFQVVRQFIERANLLNARASSTLR